MLILAANIVLFGCLILIMFVRLKLRLVFYIFAFIAYLFLSQDVSLWQNFKTFNYLGLVVLYISFLPWRIKNPVYDDFFELDEDADYKNLPDTFAAEAENKNLEKPEKPRLNPLIKRLQKNQRRAMTKAIRKSKK